MKWELFLIGQGTQVRARLKYVTVNVEQLECLVRWGMSMLL